MDGDQTFYDLLGVLPDATLQEIMDGYLRAKAAFSRDSAALYTMMSTDEGEKILKEIELAYQVLTHPERRRNYDRRFSVEGQNLKETDSVEIEKPGLQASFASAPMSMPVNVTFLQPRASEVRGSSSPPPPPQNDLPPASILSTVSALPVVAVAASTSPLSTNAVTRAEAIALETEWSGAFLRRMREECRVSIEEISAITKINKHYLLALEEETYERLPALVYVRGFVMQIARVLKLPHEKVATAYLSRLQRCQKKSS